jgi:hypothetical protein
VRMSSPNGSPSIKIPGHQYSCSTDDGPGLILVDVAVLGVALVLQFVPAVSPMPETGIINSPAVTETQIFLLSSNLSLGNEPSVGTEQERVRKSSAD